MEELSHRFDQQFSIRNGPAVRALGRILLRLDPRANPVRIRLPEVFLWENQPDTAIEHLSRLGQQYWKDQELTWARHCFQKILEWSPQQPEVQNALEEIEQQLAHKVQLEQQEQFRKKIESLLESPEPTQALVEIEAYLTQTPEEGPTAKWGAELYEKAALGENPFPPKVEPADRQTWLSHAQRIRLQFANSARSAGEYELACEQIEQILKLDPDHQEAGFQLLNTLAAAGQSERLLEQGMRLAHRYRSKGQIQAAVDTYRWLEKNGSPNPMLLGELASTLVKLNLSEEAAQVYRRQAALFLEQELYAQALSAWNEILVLFPDDLHTLQSLVQVYVLRGDMRGALIYCRKVLDQHLARNDYAEAENVLDQMIDFDPEQPSLRREKIELLYREGKQALIVNEFQALARLYLDQELINKAIEVWHEILDIEPDHREVHLQLIEGYLQKGQSALAARQYLRMAETWQVRDALYAGECLKKALQLEPEEPEFVRTYADHLAQQGMKQECLQQLDKLALILQGRGALPEAIEIYQKILRMEPENPEIVERLAGLYEESDQPGKAAPLWETLAEFYEVHSESSRAVETYLRAADHYYKVGIE